MNLWYGASVVVRNNLCGLFGVLPFGHDPELKPQALADLNKYLA